MPYPDRIYYELKIDRLPDWPKDSNTANHKLIGYYFIFRDDKSISEELTAIEVRAAYDNGKEIYSSKGKAKVELEYICEAVYEWEGGKYTTIERPEEIKYLYKRLEGYKEWPDTRFVLLPIDQLRLFARFKNSVLYISGAVIDFKCFAQKNPEEKNKSKDLPGGSNPIFTLKAEGDNNSGSTSTSPDRVRTPFLIGLPSRKGWFRTS